MGSVSPGVRLGDGETGAAGLSVMSMGGDCNANNSHLSTRDGFTRPPRTHDRILLGPATLWPESALRKLIVLPPTWVRVDKLAC